MSDKVLIGDRDISDFRFRYKRRYSWDMIVFGETQSGPLLALQHADNRRWDHATQSYIDEPRLSLVLCGNDRHELDWPRGGSFWSRVAHSIQHYDETGELVDFGWKAAQRDRRAYLAWREENRRRYHEALALGEKTWQPVPAPKPEWGNWP